MSRATDLSLQPVIEFLAEQCAASGLQVPFDIPADRAREILRGLEELGVIVPAHRVEELVQERLAALKQDPAA